MSRYLALLIASIVALQSQPAPVTTDSSALLRGTLNFLLFSNTDAVLASDSLGLSYPDGIRKEDHSCKIFLLSPHAAVTVGGLQVMDDDARRLNDHDEMEKETLKNTADRWAQLVEQHLNAIKYTPPLREFQDGVGGGLFVDIDPTGKLSFWQVSLNVARQNSALTIKAVPVITGWSFDHINAMSQGSGVGNMNDYMNGKTALGRLQTNLLEKASHENGDAKQLDEFATSLMNGAFDAANVAAQMDPKDEVRIGPPIQLLHLNLKHRTMEWIDQANCAPVPQQRQNHQRREFIPRQASLISFELTAADAHYHSFWSDRARWHPIHGFIEIDL